MRELLIVLNTRAQSFLKRAFELRWQSFVQNIATFLIFGGFALSIFLLARFTTYYLITQAHIGLFLFHRFLSMLLFMFFITVNIGNMIVSFGTLYRSQEVALLMSLPISHAKIFLIKFIDNFFYSSSTLTLLGLAMLLGYGSVFNMPWYFYFVVIFFVMLPFLLIAGILAVTALMVLIQVGARIGFKLLLVLLLSAYAIIITVYFRLTNPIMLVDQVMQVWPRMNDYLGYLDPPLVKALPNHWVAEFLYWSLQNDYGRALPYFALLLLTMFGLIALAALIARRYYYESWLAIADLQASQESVHQKTQAMFRPGAFRILPPPMNVLVRRDILMFFREPSQWLHLLLMVSLLGMFLISVSTLSLQFENPAMQANAFLLVLLFNGFLVASVALRFVFPMISLEGEAFWAVRSSPVLLQRLYWYKVLVSLMIVVSVAEVMTMGSVYLFAQNVQLTVLAGVIILFVVLTLVGLNVAAGGYFASYKEKNPIRIASSQGASLTFLGGMVYLTVVATAFVIPLNHYYQRFDFAAVTSLQWAFIPLTLVAGLSAIIFVVASAVGLRAIRIVS